ncbi:unnamed protein product [Auanema sp. JU1783]|nr:unnamed protein product [Auanema sp. JU1783]
MDAHQEVNSYKLSPYFQFLTFVLENWIVLFTTFLVLFLTTSIFNKFISPLLHEKYKEWLDYHETLTAMKTALEADYEDLWRNPEFCLIFIKLYDEYQVLLNEARSDPEGRMRRYSSFNKYQMLNLKE